MGLIDRTLRVIRANINSLINNTEDPEKILEKAVMEMQENLVLLRQALAGAIASLKRTERQAIQASSSANEWYNRAQLALEQGNEPLAHAALTKRHSYQETYIALSEAKSQQTQIVDKLKQDMRTLELKVSEVKTKKDMYIARARSAQASVKLQEILGGGVSTTSSLSAFERMENNVLQLEALGEAIAVSSTDDLEKKFSSLESDDVDSELAAMKAELKAGTKNPQHLPPST
jgi:phage shock protein A